MTPTVKKALLLLLAGGLLLGGWSLWTAVADAPKESKELKPVVVVSLSGYDKTLDNVAMLGKASGHPELARELIVILKLVAIQGGLAGPDKTRPWGAVVQADGDALAGCAFLPCADLATLASLASVLEPLAGKAEDIGGGVFRIRSHAKPVYVKQKDGWAFFAYSPEALDSPPTDPIALLAGLNTDYDAAVRVYAANIPLKQREKFAQWLNGHVEPYVGQGRYEPNRIYALRKQATDGVLRPVFAALNDLETVTVGWTLDIVAKKTSVEFSVTAQEGTETAAALANLHDVKSQFRGFRLPDAVLMGNWAAQISPMKSTAPDALVEAYRALAVGRIEQEGSRVEEGKEFVANLAELVLANVHSGRVDGGMAVLLKPDAVTLLAGGYVADGAKLTKAGKLMVHAAAQEKPAVAEWIKLDADEFQSVRFHTLSIPIPAQAKEQTNIVSLIGEKLEVAIGIGPQSAYVAVGREPLASIKQVIVQSAADVNTQKDLPPVEVSLALGTAAKFIATRCKIENVSFVAMLVAAILEKSPGRDHAKLIGSLIPRGVKYRLELEEGIVTLIGRLSTKEADEERK
jgi:hypothetical protein